MKNKKEEEIINDMLERFKDYFGEDLGETFIKIALQLQKVDELEKKYEELKKRLDRANI